MAENFIPLQIQTFVNDTTAVNNVNNNFTAVQTTFLDVLSRSGVSPNQMNSTLDMNNNQIINLPPPSTINSPARLIDVVTPGTITVVTATTGTSGHVVPFLDGANTWSNSQTITMPSGLSPAITINQTPTGSNTGSTFTANSINLVDNVQTGSFFSEGLALTHIFGGSTMTGGREALNVIAQLGAASSGSNPNRNYVAIVGQGVALTPDTGTGVSAGNSAGSVFGANFLGIAGTGATNLANVCAAEFNTTMNSGSSVYAKSICQLSGTPSDTVAGAGVNTMLWLYNQNSSSAKWNNAILIDNNNGGGSFPVASTGTIIKTGAGSTATGIDFTSTTFSNQAFQSSGFAVSPSGIIQSGGPGVAIPGQIVLNGSVSGSVSLQGNSTSNLLTISQPMQTGVIGSIAGSVSIAGQTSGSAQLTCSATGGTLQLGANNCAIDINGNVTTNGGVRIGNATAVIAGGDTTRPYLYGNTGTFGIFFGSGAPTISAAQGSLYIRSDGSSTSTRLYVNTNGSTTWTNFTSAT